MLENIISNTTFTFLFGPFGSLLCVIISVLITIFSRNHFQKTFTQKAWKYCYYYVIGSGGPMLFTWAIYYVCQFFNADPFGESVIGLFIIQLFFCSPYLFVFTIAYVIHFLIQIRQLKTEK